VRIRPDDFLSEKKIVLVLEMSKTDYFAKKICTNIFLVLGGWGFFGGWGKNQSAPCRSR